MGSRVGRGVAGGTVGREVGRIGVGADVDIAGAQAVRRRLKMNPTIKIDLKLSIISLLFINTPRKRRRFPA
jgi:hypothetical protein